MVLLVVEKKYGAAPQGCGIWGCTGGVRHDDLHWVLDCDVDLVAREEFLHAGPIPGRAAGTAAVAAS